MSAPGSDAGGRAECRSSGLRSTGALPPRGSAPPTAGEACTCSTTRYQCPRPRPVRVLRPRRRRTMANMRRRARVERGMDVPPHPAALAHLRLRVAPRPARSPAPARRPRPGGPGRPTSSLGRRAVRSRLVAAAADGAGVVRITNGTASRGACSSAGASGRQDGPVRGTRRGSSRHIVARARTAPGRSSRARSRSIRHHSRSVRHRGPSSSGRAAREDAEPVQHALADLRSDVRAGANPAPSPDVAPAVTGLRAARQPLTVGRRTAYRRPGEREWSTH